MGTWGVTIVGHLGPAASLLFQPGGRSGSSLHPCPCPARLPFLPQSHVIVTQTTILKSFIYCFCEELLAAHSPHVNVVSFAFGWLPNHFSSILLGGHNVRLTGANLYTSSLGAACYKLSKLLFAEL